jgi:hypothetical protein
MQLTVTYGPGLKFTLKGTEADLKHTAATYMFCYLMRKGYRNLSVNDYDGLRKLLDIHKQTRWDCDEFDFEISE